MLRRSQENWYRNFQPAYLRLSEEEFEERIERAYDLIKQCRLCPRNCKVKRLQGQRGFCRTARRPVISSWGPHFGEERPLVGHGGSGTIFFTHCNLGCIFCQNYSISHLGDGEETTVEKLASIMLELQTMGCHNINLVTPTHQVPMIIEALYKASKGGLNLPVVYNCGGYESVETLRLLDGIVDIYMPDIKYADPDIAERLSFARDYPDVVKRAVKEMHAQVGDLIINTDGIAERGLLVRHLVLPEGLAGTKEIMEFLVREISPDTYVNIMDQYYPCYKAPEYPPLNRRITRKEYIEAIEVAKSCGIKRIDGLTV
ncbi:MAG: radical SAM protein [Nitrospirae bacterium]|nr:radical SAM protein [Nitrospirota bacterium]